MKSTFINRNQDINNKPRKVNAQKVIDYYLSRDPENSIIPNSPLYNLAVKQYNTTVKNKSIRPSVPSWFCGKVNPITNELIVSEDDILLRAAAGFVLDPTSHSTLISSSDFSRYEIDTCLGLGPPGSYDYSLCEDNLTLERLETSGVNWAASIGVGTTHTEPEAPPLPTLTPNSNGSSFFDDVGRFLGDAADFVGDIYSSGGIIANTVRSGVNAISDVFGW